MGCPLSPPDALDPIPGLPHSFEDPALLERALTHASKGPRHNERLEFLGDAVLDLVVAELLYRERADLAEGDLTVRKSHVVSRPSLADAADRLGLTGRLKLGRGMDRDHVSASVRAGLFEAVVGAVYLDGGLPAAEAFVGVALETALDEALRQESIRVPKQLLQELAQRNGGSPPTYELLEEDGTAHSPRFRVRAVVGEEAFESAWGSTLKEAQSRAATAALEHLNQRVEENDAEEDSP